MRDLITTVLELVGILLIAAGAAAIYVPAGMITFGVGLVVIGYLEGAKPSKADPA